MENGDPGFMRGAANALAASNLIRRRQQRSFVAIAAGRGLVIDPRTLDNRNRAQGCALLRRLAMDDAQVGWIAAIIIGGVAGWLAEQFMKSDMGLLMNIVLGVIGAAVASAILSSARLMSRPGFSGLVNTGGKLVLVDVGAGSLPRQWSNVRRLRSIG
jgi:uncharacterized membrane protein YeaQ/YmgE (transglycosylase-associated protein family)